MLRHALLKRTPVLPRLTSRKAFVPLIQKRKYSDDVFLTTNAANYIDEMYAAWKDDPKSVHVSWQSYFKNLDGGLPADKAFSAPPTIVPSPSGGVPTPAAPSGAPSDITNHMKAQLLVRAYQVRGHTKAKIDPLGISFGSDKNKKPPKELTLEFYGWTDKDLDTEITLGPGILPRFVENGKNRRTLREIIMDCERIYCGSYGVEYIHIPSREECEWIRDRVETPKPYNYTPDQKRRMLDRLIWANLFETFLASKFPNDKRFGLEGAETVVVGMKTLIDRSVDAGIEDIVIGMPHRGRLNMLSNVVRKPNESIFAEFQGSAVFDEGSGDVKYHLGANYQRPTPSGKKVNLSLVANPSHLEAEDPVVLGKTRAIQHMKHDVGTFDKAMGVLMHGDAAFAGQGVVYETMGMHSLPAYSTGGTIHIIVNNQIGFTTDPRFSRSTPYPSDLAKSIDAPIFHVNADDMEAVDFIFNLAADWRATFKSDVIIDLVCYRKFGHNETDQPSFTQPLMYKKIADKPNPLDIYVDKLLKEKTFTKEDIEEHKQWVWGMLEESFKKSKDYVPHQKEWLASPWDDFKTPKELATEILPHLPTSVEEKKLKEIGKVISSVPEGFTLHRNLKRILSNRGKSVEEGHGIDWSTGEALAFGTLLEEGHHVRLSGQDVERGTFSQRHAVVHDQVNETTYVPLNHLTKDQADFTVSNSHLSEYGVMGFEYGYSLASPEALVIWEAQFGDFANTAQVIIDQFIASAETKWSQRSGLVLSLPHGYDGQGPEHSSGRIERYLLLGNEDPLHFPSPDKLERQHQDCNIQIAYPTTPANIFHLYRRQMHRAFRKPLACFFSKNLLRNPMAKSDLSEFVGESHFQWVIEDDQHGKTINNKEGIERVLFCSGQVWTALFKRREDLADKKTAIIRIEQLHPFPWEQVRELLDSYPNLKDICWAQEEPLNAGAWVHIQPRMYTTFQATKNHKHAHIRYAGRKPSASVAAGTKKLHLAEEEALLKQAFQQEDKA
ncbi:thiamine diphosphate-binding protein [Yarrowia lipolytica]|uniref:2-oxoglutarate dehydrogenase, mitochondrial n=1 Tax=Yarrowia lipolytica TaxID=4952 RepID=A0A1D8NL62_YARLL|nr:hypothetical protein YALI1_E39693g [Yarrowia lipolytica]KAB8279874.1 thiamine diphosphate-binding protein [Yarrowia lipolytica]KAE8171204.1 thiamine diphosphate-binding protein [Yarrowia lipolytica]KAJ8057714.1 thiamine diphosphate-binding protein [Yarrowia lipolytica]RMI98974.1 thiamine diphosphate-binding protein [Yarrowia lipolytica]